MKDSFPTILKLVVTRISKYSKLPKPKYSKLTFSTGTAKWTEIRARASKTYQGPHGSLMVKSMPK